MLLNYENSQVVKRDAKKVVQEAKCKSYDRLCSEFGAKDREKNI